jgi:hypothetical protein
MVQKSFKLQCFRLTNIVFGYRYKKAFTHPAKALELLAGNMFLTVVKSGYFDIVQRYSTITQQFLLFGDLPFFIKTAFDSEYPLLPGLITTEDAYYCAHGKDQ